MRFSDLTDDPFAPLLAVGFTEVKTRNSDPEYRTFKIPDLATPLIFKAIDYQKGVCIPYLPNPKDRDWVNISEFVTKVVERERKRSANRDVRVSPKFVQLAGVMKDLGMEMSGKPSHLHEIAWWRGYLHLNSRKDIEQDSVVSTSVTLNAGKKAVVKCDFRLGSVYHRLERQFTTTDEAIQYLLVRMPKWADQAMKTPKQFTKMVKNLRAS